MAWTHHVGFMNDKTPIEGAPKTTCPHCGGSIPPSASDPIRASLRRSLDDAIAKADAPLAQLLARTLAKRVGQLTNVVQLDRRRGQ
jgi:hypothetical protein